MTEALLSSGDYVQLGNALLVRFAVIDPTEEEALEGGELHTD